VRLSQPLFHDRLRGRAPVHSVQNRSDAFRAKRMAQFGHRPRHHAELSCSRTLIMRSIAGMLGSVLVCLGAARCAAPRRANADRQAPVAWHGPSPHSVHFVSYSYRSATSGSVFVARRAGIEQAASATRTNSPATAAKLKGS
jgi:hypothetical protein